MITVDALNKLQEADTTGKAYTILAKAKIEQDAVALPDGFRLVDLEPYKDLRRRMRGNMTTTSLASFAEFSREHQLAEHTACFVDAEKMQAQIIFNLGDHEVPGHADHTAALALQKSAEYKSLLAITSKPRTQKELAEWMEDMEEHLEVVAGDDKEIDIKQAITAVRKIDIKQTKNVGSEQKSLSASRTAFESIEASSESHLPAGFTFKCFPYKELPAREFQLRLSVLTSGDVPMLALHIRLAEVIAEQIAQEFVDLLKTALKDVPVYIGVYSSK